MVSYEGLVRLNQTLSGFYRLIWLNLLWVVTCVLGLGLLGVGPATYAFAKYVDRWFRLGELPPMTRTFRSYLTELRWRPVLVSWVLLAGAVVIGVNLVSVSSWYLRMANLAALVLLAVIGAYVYFVLAAMDVRSLRSTLSAALLLGMGSLHWTILGTTAVTAVYWLMYRFAAPLLPLVGIALPMAVVGLIVRPVFRQLAADDAAGAADDAAGATPAASTSTAPCPTAARPDRNDAPAATPVPGPTGPRELHLEKGSVA
ncbi:YesL family protein [Ruania albidiflava]|uniref:YesL family protein n=1 Tax=Ruania albidiflava TaxID=366586 RepID=UPI0003B6EFA2|nr:DUF624 domain-containing protein [Ruania albidiflava]